MPGMAARALRGALCALAGGPLLLAAGLAAAGAPRAERPIYAVGDRWFRQDGVYDLVRIENDRYVFAAGPRREIHLTKALGLARIQKGGSVMEFDPPPELAWPLEIGKWGVVSGLWRTPQNPAGLRATFTWKAEAYEDVTVSAGTFKAFRIALSIQGSRWGGPSRDAVIWYAPEARQLVKAESHHMGMLNFQVVVVDRPTREPLEIVLEGPADQARLDRDAVVVAGKAVAGKGVARVTIALNGREISRQEAPQGPRPEASFSVPLTLREGKNILLVTAVDPEGGSRQEARTVFFDRPAPVIPQSAASKPGAPEAPPPRHGSPPSAVGRPVPPAPPAAPVPPPFRVTLAAPGKDEARVDQESIPLAGVVSGGKGVSRVVVTLNGAEVSRLEHPAPRPALALNLALKLREGANTLVVTATEADGTIHQEIRTVQYDKRVPLTIAVRYPEDRARVTEAASVVAAMVTSSKGVAAVSVALNGQEVHQQRERTPQKSVAVAVPVTLREGANAITITASEADGTLRQEIRAVIYDKPQVAAAPPAPPPPPRPVNRDLWAVVIGVGRYDNPDIPTLQYTVADAEAVYQALVGVAGFKKEHVLLLTDKTEKRPTLRNVKWALGTFLARSAKKDDTVLIFFAGHGAPEVDQRGVERDGLSKYLVPGDADPDDLYSTGLPMDELQTVFGRIEAERVVAFLDACYSGAAGGRTFASKRTRAGQVDDLFLERLTRSKGRAIITASRPAEVSIELPELGHGIFTYYLVQALKGAGDLNRDGIVSLQELYGYVEEQVTRKSRAVGGNQHPVMKGELEGALPLVKLGGR